jgi:hypothetical protein
LKKIQICSTFPPLNRVELIDIKLKEKMPTLHRQTKSADNDTSRTKLTSDFVDYGSTPDPLRSNRPRSYSLPKDHYYLVYIVFFLQGVGMLFPWNVFITASEYFHTRFKGTSFSNNFENIFSFCYSGANLFFMILLVNYAHLEIFNMRTTVAIPQIITATIFATTTAMVEITMTGNTLFTITTIFILLCGFTAALIQSGIFGLSGRFPPVYTQAVMSGQGVAGMSVSIISLASILSTPCGSATPNSHSIERASFSYFLASTIVIVATLLAFLALTRSDFAQHYAFSEIGGSPRQALYEDEEDEESHAISNDNAVYNLEQKQAIEDALLTPRTRRRIIAARKNIMSAPVFQPSSPDTSAQSSLQGSRRASLGPSPGGKSPESANSPIESPTDGQLQSSTPIDVITFDLNSDEFTSSNINDHTEKWSEEERISTCELISHIWRNCFSVCLCFAITLSVFPGVTSEILSSANLDNKRCPKDISRFFGAGVWQSVFFLLFNGGDTLGRLLAAAKQCVPKRYVFILSLFRLVFIPLFLNCNVVTSTPTITPNSTYLFSTEHTDPRLGFFSADYWPIIFMCMLSISNGYVASLEMMNGPGLVPDGQQSRAGTIMAFFLVLGLVLGSICSFGVRAIACQCNPFVG